MTRCVTPMKTVSVLTDSYGKPACLPCAAVGSNDRVTARVDVDRCHGCGARLVNDDDGYAMWQRPTGLDVLAAMTKDTTKEESEP